MGPTERGYDSKSGSVSLNKTIRNSKENVDQSDILCNMVDNYMKIVDTSIKDMVLKYIVLDVVQRTESYVDGRLSVHLFADRNSTETKLELLQTDGLEQRRIDELLQNQSTIEQALKSLIE